MGVWSELPVSSRGRAPGQRGGGSHPPKAENLSAFGCPAVAASSAHSRVLQTAESSSKRYRKNSPDQSWEQPWQKCGGHVNPMTTPLLSHVIRPSPDALNAYCTPPPQSKCRYQ